MKFRKTIVAALLAAVLLSTFAWAASPAGVRFDFETGDSGFTPIDADYPVGNGVDEFYELQHSWVPCRTAAAGSSYPATTTATTCSWGMSKS